MTSVTTTYMFYIGKTMALIGFYWLDMIKTKSKHVGTESQRPPLPQTAAAQYLMMWHNVSK